MGKKYKLKTHMSTVKRFNVSGSGMVVRTKGGKSHFRRRTSKRVKRLLSKTLAVTNKKEAKRIRMLAPYLAKYKTHPPA